MCGESGHTRSRSCHGRCGHSCICHDEAALPVFDKAAAMALIEDAISNTVCQFNLGMVRGYCAAFYMCGLLSKEEWEEYSARIPRLQS